MALIKVAPTRITEIFIAEEPIGALTSICLSSPGKKIRAGSSTTQEWVAGATIAGGVSGGPVRIVTHGIVSGLICGALVSAGDRVTSFTSGKITPLNTITPAGAISGSVSPTSGWTALASGLASGMFVGISSGSFAGTAFNTARILGKALDNGGVGSGIRVLVDIGG